MTDANTLFADHNWETRAGGRMLLYFGPHVDESLDHRLVRDLVRRKRAWGAFWNYGWNRGDGPWYAYVCDTIGYDLDKIESKNSRKTIRRSLERCAVRPIEASWLAANGYGMYLRATTRYQDYKVMSQEEFVADLRAAESVPGVRIYGVFVEEALAAYGIAYDLGKSVRFREAFFDPEYSHAKPMYALYYVLANDCLNGGFTEIDAGWRPLVHETEIEEFFRRMGWRHAPCRIGLYLTWRLKLALHVARALRKPLQRLLPARHWRNLEALLVAHDTARRSQD